MIKTFRCHCILLALVGWVGVSISVFGFVGDYALRRHYVRDGDRSKASVSAYLQKMESEFLNGHVQKQVVFQQMARSHELLIDDVLDYLLAMRLLLLLLFCVSAVALSIGAKQNRWMRWSQPGKPLKNPVSRKRKKRDGDARNVDKETRAERQ